MKNPDMIKRYTMFMVGVIASALGISLITKAGLGTSPVTSPAFVLTFLFPFSLGNLHHDGQHPHVRAAGRDSGQGF